MTASLSILEWVKCFMFPTVLHGWEMCCFIFPLLDFYFLLHSFWVAQAVQNWFFLFFLCVCLCVCAFTKFYHWEMLLIDTKGQLSRENKLCHFLLLVSPIPTSYLSSLSSFSWPCEMATVICTSVLVMKQKIHSVAAWRFLCWSVDQVKLWQRKPQCTFSHCSARTVCTFSHVYFLRWALWSFVHCTHSRKMFYTRFFFFFFFKSRKVMFLMHFFQ